MGSTATIVTTGSIQEMEKYNIYNLYICTSSSIVSRLQAGLLMYSTFPSFTDCQVFIHTLHCIRHLLLSIMINGHLYSPVAETQARLGLHTSKLKYSKTHEKVIKRNKNCQSIQLRFEMNIDIAMLSS